jgi:FixJ family two-component response regulator
MTDSEAIVFVVDDDPSVRRSLKRLIRSAGFTVESFASAQEFIEHPRPDMPGCLVLDIQMPGVSGLELQDEIARAGLNLPVIFLTGYGTVAPSVRAMKAGACDFLEKPVDDNTLVEAIHQAVELMTSVRHELPDVFVIDVRMPGLSGLELQRELAASGSRVPVIFITAYQDDQARTLAHQAGAVANLEKPVDEQVLLEAIRAGLKRQTSETPASRFQ